MVIREFAPGSALRDFEQLLPAFLAIWNAPQDLRFLSFSLRPFAPEADNARMLRLLLSFDFRPVRIEHHRRADGADLVVLQKQLVDDLSPAG